VTLTQRPLNTRRGYVDRRVHSVGGLEAYHVAQRITRRL